ncbi:MAG: hypothetical protein ABFS18_09825 [Thermodesulfobacteriota bacterium]
MNYNFVFPRWWKRGRPAELFAKEEVFIEKFVSKYKLQALSPEAIDQLSLVAGGVIIEGMPIAVAPVMSESHENLAIKEIATEPQKTKEFAKLKIPSFPGGIRTPHIHFRGDVFLLNSKQWHEFSSTIIKDIQERLANAKSISFEQVMELSEATSSLV